MVVLKKNLGFMQTGRGAHLLAAMAGGLQKAPQPALLRSSSIDVTTRRVPGISYLHVSATKD